MAGLDVELAGQAFRVAAPDVEAVRSGARAQRREIVRRDVVIAVAQRDRHGGRAEHDAQRERRARAACALDRLRGEAHRGFRLALHPHEPREHGARERRHVDAERRLRARRFAGVREAGRSRLRSRACACSPK
jgi:hypothetical protein